MLTFLFTDIADSSRLWQAYPQAMSQALAAHDAVLQRLIRQFNGQIVKTTGDGVHATFERVSDAAQAVVAVQKQLAALAWPATGPLRVRMGLHTGDAEARDGDYYGTSVNKAARVMSLAAGGQVLLTEITHALLQEAAGRDFGGRSLGTHRLKGLEGRTAIYQLTHPDLEFEFPNIHGGEAVPNNLPEELTSFVGREAETDRLIGYLLDTESDPERRRLVTLIGPGGTGKTRLSIRVARAVREAFSDGVWLIELAPLSDPKTIPGTVLSALGLQETGEIPSEQVIGAYLRDKQALLIFDNCEHLVEASARLIEQILQAAPLVQVLASSREALGIYGETVLRLPSLPLPGEEEVDWEAVQRSAAVRLFAARAEAAGARQWLSPEHGPAIAQICRRLDGIPLAIEMAAARLRIFSPAKILERLDDRFRLLTGGTRTALPRLQTLQALIDWSYDLLGEEEKSLFQDLSVFAGGWTIDMVEQICLISDVYSLLPQLVDKSLVTAEPHGDGVRYRFLETMRQYARDRLMESGRSAEVRDRHLAYFVAISHSDELVDTSPVAEYFFRMAPELENCRTALTWAIDRDPLSALELAGNLLTVWTNGPVREGIRWIDRAIEMVEGQQAQYNIQGSGQRLMRLLGVGYLARSGLMFQTGHTERALEAARQSIEYFELIEEDYSLGVALALFALSGISLGIREPALDALEKVSEMRKEDGSPLVRATLLNLKGLARIYLDMDLANAAALMEQAVAIEPAIATRSISGIFALIKIQALSQNWDRARELVAIAEEGVKNSVNPNNKRQINMYMSERAHIERQSGNLDAALNIYARMIVSYRELSMEPAVANLLECFAMIAVARAQFDRAARLFGAAESLREQIGADMTSYERMEYDAAVGALGAMLDPETLAAAWLRGRTMTIDQAINTALDYAETTAG